VRIIDGRLVRHPLSNDDWNGAGAMTRKLSEAYKALAKKEATRSL
jgi:branched-chain amino acid aminotransferase